MDKQPESTKETRGNGNSPVFQIELRPSALSESEAMKERTARVRAQLAKRSDVIPLGN